MGVFNTKAVLRVDTKLIPIISSRIIEDFKADGYEVFSHVLNDGSIDISLSKGDYFKAILGMATALKVNLQPQDKSILFNAGIGVFGKETIPAIISCFFMWPLLVTQIWGLVKQSKIDDKALEIARSVVKEHRPPSTTRIYTLPPQNQD